MEDAEIRFRALFEAYYPKVVRFAARRTDPDSAPDVAAETFLVAWRRFGEMPDDADWTLPWLYRIAHNVLANERRGLRRRVRLSARLGSMGSPAGDADPAGGVVEALDIRSAMDRLHPRDQETLRLVAWDGLDVPAAAQVAGCSPRTFAVRLHRARRRLDAALARTENDEPATGRTPVMGEGR